MVSTDNKFFVQSKLQLIKLLIKKDQTLKERKMMLWNWLKICLIKWYLGKLEINKLLLITSFWKGEMGVFNKDTWKFFFLKKYFPWNKEADKQMLIMLCLWLKYFSNVLESSQGQSFLRKLFLLWVNNVLDWKWNAVMYYIATSW